MLRIFSCRIFGAFYGFFNRISLVQLETDNKTCVSCGSCSNICPMDVDPAHDPNSMECIRCDKCISACKVHAISYVRPWPVKENISGPDIKKV